MRAAREGLWEGMAIWHSVFNGVDRDLTNLAKEIADPASMEMAYAR
jgi:hypothetical protein